MIFSNVDPGLIELNERIGHAPAVGPELMAEFIARACPRLRTANLAARAEHISRLIGAKAWMEAALFILELELPRWRLRRIMHEDGAWYCRLSRQWNVPDWLADSVETRHECMVLAILAAMVEARQCDEPATQHSASSVPSCSARSREADGADAFCCDNFA